MPRFAILDIDAHPGDGTRAFTAGDPAVPRVCLCDASSIFPAGTRGDVALPAALWRAAADLAALDLVTALIPPVIARLGRGPGEA